MCTYPTNYFAKYKDGSWNGYETGMDGSVYALAYGSNKLYAGGDFTAAGSASGLYSLAQWNGSTWSAVGNFGSGRQGVVVNALACDSAGVLYVAWSNIEIIGLPVYRHYISKWSNNTWTVIASPEGDVKALACSGTTLYAGGFFTLTSGNTTIISIGKYNGASWSAMPGLEDGAWIEAIAVSGSNVYVGGGFETPSKGVAVWNGTSWSGLGSGLNSYVYALAVDASGRVYAGGSFTSPVPYLAVYK